MVTRERRIGPRHEPRSKVTARFRLFGDQHLYNSIVVNFSESGLLIELEATDLPALNKSSILEAWIFPDGQEIGIFFIAKYVRTEKSRVAVKIIDMEPPESLKYAEFMLKQRK